MRKLRLFGGEIGKIVGEKRARVVFVTSSLTLASLSFTILSPQTTEPGYPDCIEDPQGEEKSSCSESCHGSLGLILREKLSRTGTRD